MVKPKVWNRTAGFQGCSIQTETTKRSLTSPRLGCGFSRTYDQLPIKVLRMQTCFPCFPTTSLPLLRSLGNSTNLTVENGRDKCVHCAWEGRLARFRFVHVRRKVSGIDDDGDGSGGGGGSPWEAATTERPIKREPGEDMGTDPRKEVERSYGARPPSPSVRKVNAGAHRLWNARKKSSLAFLGRSDGHAKSSRTNPDVASGRLMKFKQGPAERIGYVSTPNVLFGVSEKGLAPHFFPTHQRGSRLRTWTTTGIGLGPEESS
ncbi:hypothetical protein EAG_10704 [Camponotus floridanus]|uniref:Uncharacterized protein n=1 Tax=Camponotus floridanus TaxID=104421 RepID=E2AEP5_CAMFO|nr:hypothetical protein EAG_10704 [Camponotus floridanus]